jgi:hypothetical protein
MKTKPWKIPEGIDEECIHLCVLLNSLPGINTIDSCCGHNNYPYRIWFNIDNVSCQGLRILLRAIDPRYYGYKDGKPKWEIKVDSSDIFGKGKGIYFLLEGSLNEYKDLFKSINHVLSQKDFMKKVKKYHTDGRKEGRKEGKK